MPHSKIYTVSAQVSPPQPHVNYDTKPSTSSCCGQLCSGWFPFTLAGVLAITFIVCINQFGGKVLFMVGIDPFAGLVPIVKKGELQIYPHFMGSHNGILSIYSTFLPPENLTSIVNELDTLFEMYPKEQGTVYRNCWLVNPTPEHPCFFKSSWVTELCTKDKSYGYEEQNGYYNPCFIMKLGKTGTWMPAYTRGVPGHFDPSFVPVECLIINPGNSSWNEGNSSMNIAVYPSKGFSRLFFPAAKFNSKKYVAPLVAVKVNGIRKGDNITVQCSVITPNAFILWNNGKAIVDFTSA